MILWAQPGLLTAVPDVITFCLYNQGDGECYSMYYQYDVERFRRGLLVAELRDDEEVLSP